MTCGGSSSLGAAKRCFARNGFAGTTTKSVAAAAAISEALLFKHFPSKAALYAEILAEECEADPDLAHLLGQEPSTATLVELMRGMVRHFMHVSDGPDQEESAAAAADDHEPSRRRRVRPAALCQGREADRAGVRRFARSARSPRATRSRIGSEPLNLFWFAHHTVLMAALTRLPAVPCLAYGNAADLERQLCEFLLRGIGLNEAAIALASGPRRVAGSAAQPVTAESA